MNTRQVLKRLDELQEAICDLRLLVMENIPKTPHEKQLDSIVEDTPLLGKETPRQRMIRIGIANGVFTDDQG